MTNAWSRIAGALSGGPQAQLPFAFWWHNYAAENRADDLAQETIRVHQEHSFDITKPQVRAQSFAEVWGLRFEPSTDPGTRFRVTQFPLASVNDIRALPIGDSEAPVLTEQLDALRAIRHSLGPDQPIVWTVFAPALVLTYMSEAGASMIGEVLASHRVELDAALGRIAETLARHVAAVMEAGADGVFYATNLAGASAFSEDDSRRLHEEHDHTVLAAARAARLNILHLGGREIHWKSFARYPVHVLNWDVYAPGNPTIPEVLSKTSLAAMGGVPIGAEFDRLSAQELSDSIDALAAETDRRRFLIGAGGSLRYGASAELLGAIRRAAHCEQADAKSAL